MLRIITISGKAEWQVDGVLASLQPAFGGDLGSVEGHTDWRLTLSVC